MVLIFVRILLIKLFQSASEPSKNKQTKKIYTSLALVIYTFLGCHILWYYQQMNSVTMLSLPAGYL